MMFVPGIGLAGLGLNTALSLSKDHYDIIVSNNDSLGIIVPMYDERTAATKSLEAILDQSKPFDKVVVSINGINGESDNTADSVAEALKGRYTITDFKTLEDHVITSIAPTEACTGLPEVLVIEHYNPTKQVFNQAGKADSINFAVEQGYVDTDRIAIIDGDTIVSEKFSEKLREHFYRAKIVKKGKNKELVIEDFGLQSGAVTSFTPQNARFTQKIISQARKAEYAVSRVIREGQTRQLGNGLFSNTRLFTATGCGYSVRTDSFPMPHDTKTEDHDHTIQIQNAKREEVNVSIEDIERLGLRFKIKGRDYDIRELLEEGDSVRIIRGGNARFVQEAIMSTEDPNSLPGLASQLERWNGGAQQVLAKRRPKNKNLEYQSFPAAFPVRYAFIENVAGIGLLSGIIAAGVINTANPSIGIPLEAIAAGLAIDTALVSGVTGRGFYLQNRAEGRGKLESSLEAIAETAKTAPFYLGLRYFNPLMYVSAGFNNIREGIKKRKDNNKEKITWDRSNNITEKKNPAVRRVGAITGLGITTLAALALSAPMMNPINNEAWILTNRGDEVVSEKTHEYLFEIPALRQEDTRRIIVPSINVSLNEQDSYCAPGTLRNLEPKTAVFNEAYEPLSGWGYMMAARLAPVNKTFMEAVESYNIDALEFLKIMMNESYFDPLAKGKTNDVGLTQVTPDAINLVSNISRNARSEYFNPGMLSIPESAFDIEYNICNGAAKYAFVQHIEGTTDEYSRYAAFINPVEGIVNGIISPRHQNLVTSLDNVDPLARQIAGFIAQGINDPARLSPRDRQLWELYSGMNEGVDFKSAYEQTASIVRNNGVNDATFYDNVLNNYFIH